MYQLRKKIFPIVLPSMFEAENFLDHSPISPDWSQLQSSSVQEVGAEWKRFVRRNTAAAGNMIRFVLKGHVCSLVKDIQWVRFPGP
jgi:hypothetical protein